MHSRCRLLPRLRLFLPILSDFHPLPHRVFRHNPTAVGSTADWDTKSFGNTRICKRRNAGKTANMETHASSSCMPSIVGNQLFHNVDTSMNRTYTTYRPNFSLKLSPCRLETIVIFVANNRHTGTYSAIRLKNAYRGLVDQASKYIFISWRLRGWFRWSSGKGRSYRRRQVVRTRPHLRRQVVIITHRVSQGAAARAMKRIGIYRSTDSSRYLSKSRAFLR